MGRESSINYRPGASLAKLVNEKAIQCESEPLLTSTASYTLEKMPLGFSTVMYIQTHNQAYKAMHVNI